MFLYHDAFNPDKKEINELKERYRKGTVGDVEVKKKLIRAINDFLNPIRARRHEYMSQPNLIEDIIRQGTKRVTDEGRQTVRMMREAMGMTYFR